MGRSIFVIVCILTLFPQIMIGAEIDSLIKKEGDFLVLPIIFYTTETKLAAGAMVNYYFRVLTDKLYTRPSSILTAITYTQNHQIMSEINTDIYSKNETYNLNSRIAYVKFPNKFYGIGNNTPEDAEEDFTSKTFSLKLNILKKMYSALRIGFQYEFEQNRIIRVERNGLLAQGDILGSQGGMVSGAGLMLNWDTRDNIFCPSSGSFYQLSTILFNHMLASDYNFSRYTIELRKYFSLFSSHILALQGYMNVITGDPPFEMMSLFGGRERMRGYFEGRYRDKDMIAFQIEYRIVPLWWRFGIVGFVGLGDVSNNIKNFEIKKFKYSIGCGLRYLFNLQEKINLRLDMGYGKNTSGIYITFGEAF